MGGIVVRVGIVSDIHGNWTALQAVIRRMDELGVEVVLGAGDYLWTTTGDQRVVDWVRQMAHRGCFVRGNGDSMAYYERHKHLAHEDPRPIYEFVASLPERLVVQLAGYRILLQHEWWRGERFLGQALVDHITRPPYVSDEVDLQGIDIAVFGDSHLPLHHATPEVLIVHPGSVGAPFDRDPTQAKFATLDLAPDGVLLEHHAVPFDIEAANREILDGRKVDIGHSYFRKMTESRLLVTSPNPDFWIPVPPAVRWARAREKTEHPG
jgi:putative phosphoesterase